MARAPKNPRRRRTPSARGDFIGGEFVTFKELSSQVDAAFNRYCDRRQIESTPDGEFKTVRVKKGCDTNGDEAECEYATGTG